MGKKSEKIYGGIYKTGPSAKTDQFIMTDSMQKAETKLAKYYLYETIAHNYQLAKTGLIDVQASKKILKALVELLI